MSTLNILVGESDCIHYHIYNYNLYDIVLCTVIY
jgi:hypothetical protein